MMREENIYFYNHLLPKRSMSKLKSWNKWVKYFIVIHWRVYGYGVNGFQLTQL